MRRFRMTATMPGSALRSISYRRYNDFPVRHFSAQTTQPLHAPGASRLDLAVEPTALEQLLDAIDRRIAFAPGAPLLAERRANLLRALGRLEEARNAYARVAAGDPASRVHRILSERTVDWTDRAGPVPFVRIENFLRPDEQARLWEVVADPAASFFAGSVKGDAGESDNVYLRKAEVMRRAGPVRQWFMPQALELIEQDDVLARLGFSRFALGRFELQVTRHADGAHLWCHRDIGPAHPDRHISYVYYFHRQPRGFSGGDLLLFDQDAKGVRGDLLAFTRIIPTDNMLILFPSDRWHSVSR
ncbi:MAG: hypothetical protein EOP58_02195, partial [Sphingomonadales bacterium]